LPCIQQHQIMYIANWSIYISRIKKKIDVEIVKKITHMLDEHNVHAKSFRMATDRYREQQFDKLNLRLIVDRTKDGRIYNIPNVSKVATLIVGDIDIASSRIL